ncbi:aminofutalosine synthase MqnE [Xylanibacillus composti]|uniref:Aminodeoxyfutalosine synthase n=1 Tax=Xylanibacillus composti TaxID=1572762 RepID=A0A8J4H4B8_9BACL|nr:aminofutalosine synthase MqnE [Xylanibacillus composti]MDT9723511.1 aminofutalosine synthase MqnE [Xylanibacillus composti]GIQ68453.1 aminodeoxyfutalosine synthase [Xylanibacillus composti]
MSIVLNQSDKQMQTIAEKVRSGQRLSLEDGLYLYQTEDLLTLGQLANEANLRKNGRKTYFIENMTLYFTNVCEATCAFCAFKRNPGEEGAYTHSPEEVIAFAEQHYHPGVREFHITGGHNPEVPFDYYVNSIRALKQRFPEVTIKSYTAAEIEFFSRISGLSYKEVLQRLMDAGLGTLTGGGAEILSERYRKKMSVNKATTEQWLDVHRTAHQLGLRTHATMLYGSIETLEERLQHMIQLRELQDETNGFMVFIPLAVQPKSVHAGIKRRTTAFEDLRTIAISRLMLDNFQHIKAYFINIGTQLTQLALTFGASDVHGTMIKERISHAAGALSQEGLTRDELVWLIQGAGRIAVERDTFYNEINVYE